MGNTIFGNENTSIEVYIITQNRYQITTFKSPKKFKSTTLEVKPASMQRWVSN